MIVCKATAVEDSAAILMARLVDQDGEYITSGDIDSITCEVYDLTDTDGSAIATPSVVVATTVFDSLQATDAAKRIWLVDSTGYNFRHVLPPSALPDGNKTYRVEYLFSPVNGEDFYLLYELQTLKVSSS